MGADADQVRNAEHPRIGRDPEGGTGAAAPEVTLECVASAPLSKSPGARDAIVARRRSELAREV